MRGSPAHSCSSAVADDGVAHRARRVEQVVALVEQPTRDAAGAGDPAGVGLLRAGEQRSSVDLPPPLRPTTPIRSPSSRPSETPSSRVRVPQRERDAFRAEQVCHVV